MRKNTTRSAVLAATAALALVGGGVANAAGSAEGSSGSSGSLSSSEGSSGSSTGSSAAPGTPYEFRNWDTCRLDLAYDPDTGLGTCMTVIIRDGNMRIGNLDVAVPDGSLMIAGGVTGEQVFVPAADDGKFGVYANPITVPGGAFGAASAENFGPTAIQATVEAVALPDVDPYNLAVQLPVRLKLSNPLLGDNCYIGSAATPINLSLALVGSAGPTEYISTNGPEVPGYVWPQAPHTAADFAVPGASGCGPLGSLNWAVNLRAGLPSAGAGNSLSTTSAVYNVAGWELDEYLNTPAP
ncbi:hypothetical protein GS467_01115 [Rhodococcus hoagii]|nr:hypothetical protein [Prescottella equi]NKR94513.1 hypothetical protein [Prescottella equi]NKS19824.1 hypothetical protein [Prescottella equi]